MIWRRSGGEAGRKRNGEAGEKQILSLVLSSRHGGENGRIPVDLDGLRLVFFFFLVKINKLNVL